METDYIFSKSMLSLIESSKIWKRIKIVVGKGTLQGPRKGFCLTFGNVFSEEAHTLTKAKDFIGKRLTGRAVG